MLYLDTSAFLKLLVDEEHSSDLRTSLDAENIWSSSLLDMEAHRAGRRLGLPADMVSEHLDAITIFTPGDRTFAAARNVGPDTLRTIDALHLAAALELGADLDAVVTYDRRLAAGCTAAGCNVKAPGLSDGWWETSQF
ncbi:MAG TPA: PIN domain-containing protein [Ilumatobacteraceae bacterium]|nr:PIN domain-containing protein [Ilumatobacteraceae bacterium]